MIKDSIKNFKSYVGICSAFDKALDLAIKMDENTPCGRVDVDDDLYYNVMTFIGKDKDDAVAETHNNYIDIQFILQGKEIIGYAPKERLVNTQEYDENKDIAFWQGGFEFMLLDTLDFGIYYPQDAHAPGIAVDDKPIKKVVFKIKLSVLGK